MFLSHFIVIIQNIDIKNERDYFWSILNATRNIMQSAIDSITYFAVVPTFFIRRCENIKQINVFQTKYF